MRETKPQKTKIRVATYRKGQRAKAEMEAREVEELIAGQYIIRWTSVLSQRFDSTSFKKVLPDLYKAYTKQVSSRRFSISV